MKYISLFLFTITLYSCSSQNELDELKEENTKLRAQILALKLTQPNYSFSSIVISKKSELKLGEEYFADARLAVIDKENPPITILGKINEEESFIPSGDTLPYNPELGSATYRFTPKDTGTFTWAGEIIYNIAEKKHEFPFRMTYKVKK